MAVSFADGGDPDSLASRLRLARNRRFRTLIDHLPHPLSILDVDGTAAVRERIGVAVDPDIRTNPSDVDGQTTG